MPPMSATPPTPGPSRHGPRYQPLVLVLAAVAAGVATNRFGPLPLAAWGLAALGGIAAWWGLWRQGRLRLAAAAVLLAAAATAASWHHAPLVSLRRRRPGTVCPRRLAAGLRGGAGGEGPRLVPPADAAR